jgi:hypothetical protein
MNIKLTKTIRQTAMGVLRLSTRKQSMFRTKLFLLLIMLTGQLLAVEYTVSPSGYTNLSTDEVTWNAQT